MKEKSFETVCQYFEANDYIELLLTPCALAYLASGFDSRVPRCLPSLVTSNLLISVSDTLLTCKFYPTNKVIYHINFIVKLKAKAGILLLYRTDIHSI